MDKKFNFPEGYHYIKKSARIIEARYDFDLWEQRLFLSLIYQINKEGSGRTDYRLFYNDITRMFRTRNTTLNIRKAELSLLEKLITVDHIPGLETYNILQDVRHGNYKRQDYADIIVDSRLIPLLAYLYLSEDIVTYDFKNIVHLSAYSIRIYEILKLSHSLGQRTIGIDRINWMLMLEKDYPVFNKLYKKVLSPVVNEINSYTDIEITYMEAIKENGAVIAICFYFKNK